MRKEIKIIIAGGGTGGHIFPAIAIAGALKKQCPQIALLFVGAKGKMEMEKVPQAGYEIKGLTIAGFNRSNIFKNFSLPFKLLKSFFQVRSIFSHFKPDAVIGVGGYSSFPVLKFAQLKNIPTFIQEANSYGGKSNILLSQKAIKIFTGTPDMEKFFPANKIIFAGNPVRESISTSSVSKEEACAFFGIDATKKTVLSVGGSLGAASINKVISKNLKSFSERNIQLIWQTGKNFTSGASSEPVYKSEFITKMDYAYKAADVVISRSGAMSVAELEVAKKAVVFVPYPFAAEDHQTANAKKLVDKNAALLVKDNEVDEKLIPTVLRLLQNDDERFLLENNIAKFAIHNADEIIASEILKYLNAQ